MAADEKISVSACILSCAGLSVDRLQIQANTMVKAIYQIVCALVSIELVSAYLVAPPGTAAPGTTSSCSGWVQMSYSLTCAIIESYFGLTETEFEEWVGVDYLA